MRGQLRDFLGILRERVAVYDGAMGTNIQAHAPTIDDYWGKEGCNELLVLSRPDIIRSIHAGFLEVGCDVIETDSFGSSRVVLAEYELQDRTRELNIAAAKLAREVAQDFSSPEWPRFVAGSIGPTTKLPSLGHISYDAMAEMYREQAEALIEGGVDILLIETSQDLLQAKIALAACQDAMHKAGKRLPLQMQVTLEATGAMLLGSEIGAALAVVECFQPDIVGLNCATGPEEMNDAVRFLCQNASRPVSVQPNAGLPQNEGGRAVYKLTPAGLAAAHRRFVTEYGVQVVGGCCGTTPSHLKAVVEAVKDATPAPREEKSRSVAASAFSAVPLEVDGQPVVVAEEMNTTTRVEHFRNMVRAGDFDGILALAKKLTAEGSQMLDLCCAIVGEDESGYMNGVLEKIATRVTAPILVDSTEAEVIEEALKRIPGKPLINSINLEDGEKRTARVLPMARRYGAAVIALTIDEEGMALTAEKKVAIAHRIYKLATEKYGLRGQDILFDPLTLPISTGQEEYRTAGMETLEAVRRIKKEIPLAKTILGVSNISFGLSAYSRRVLNSVFLKEAVDRGLDCAIVNYSKIYPLYRIPEAEVDLARRLIFRQPGESEADPLQAYMAHFAARSKNAVAEEAGPDAAALTIEEKLKQFIIRGEKSIGEGKDKRSLIEVLDDALERYSPLDLINTVLLDGMKTVGVLFGERKMQLPSVLDSAAVMKASVAYLEPKMERVEGTQKGTIVLATVKGDVHDIGKNLVDIILSNNGYKVVNLGIKQPADVIIKAAGEHHADAIGLSGLLVKSTLEMKFVIQDLERLQLEFPVICGGAALTRKYVEEDLRKEYSSSVLCRGRLRRSARHERFDRRRRAPPATLERGKDGEGIRRSRARGERRAGGCGGLDGPLPGRGRCGGDSHTALLRRARKEGLGSGHGLRLYQHNRAVQEPVAAQDRVGDGLSSAGGGKIPTDFAGSDGRGQTKRLVGAQGGLRLLSGAVRRQRSGGLRSRIRGARPCGQDLSRTAAHHISSPARRAKAFHRGFFRAEIRRENGRRRLFCGDGRISRQRGNPKALRPGRFHPLSVCPRIERGDGRGPGRAGA